MKKADVIPRTNWALVGVSVVIAYALSQYEPFHNFVQGLGEWGYIGLFIVGFFFAFTFTVSIAIVTILLLAQIYPLWIIALVAGFGATVGDFFIYKFIRDHIVASASQLLKKFRKHPLSEVAKTKFFKWTLPILGAIIIATPFPDELGMTLLGIAKIKTYQFMILSFVLNLVSISIVTMAAVVIIL